MLVPPNQARRDNRLSCGGTMNAVSDRIECIKVYSFSDVPLALPHDPPISDYVTKQDIRVIHRYQTIYALSDCITQLVFHNTT